MQDRPTPDQLLEAVAAFLREQVVPVTAGPVSFHARVAANALDIAGRQMALGPYAHAREQAALEQLLGVEPGHDVMQLNRMLCERIASGAMTLDTPGLAACLWQLTLDKLAVDQPGYETYVRALCAAAAPDDKER